MSYIRFKNDRSALRTASKYNPRVYPRPTCGVPSRLTLRDIELGHQCDRCADTEEGF